MVNLRMIVQSSYSGQGITPSHLNPAPRRSFTPAADFCEESGRLNDSQHRIASLKFATLFGHRIHQVQQIAIKAHKILGVRHQSKVDVRLILRVTLVVKLVRRRLS